jgi:putative DNA primase/helicase
MNTTTQSTSPHASLREWLPTEPEAKVLSLSTLKGWGVVGGGVVPADPAPVQRAFLTFPDMTPFGSIPPTTIGNIRHLLQQRGVRVRYNVVTKRTEILIPGLVTSLENADSSAMTHIVSMAAGAGLSTGRVAECVQAIADVNLFNPAETWIRSKDWDGEDRLPEFYSTLTVHDDFPNELKETVMYHWMLSATAAATMPSGFKTRGVLTLQGPQGLGKTTWIQSLVDEPGLRSMLIRGEHLLDTGDKDSVLTALSGWVVELGELESTFKKDIGRLKAFITRESDRIRPPYGKCDNLYPRRTVFCATVNEQQFLVDPTGNTRWWTLPVVDIKKTHDIDMQQVFAQLASHLSKGARWWLSDENEKWLESFNKQHTVASAISEKLSNIIDADRMPTNQDPYMGTVELLHLAGVNSPRNPDMKEAVRALRVAYGEPKKVSGSMKWRVCLRRTVRHDQTQDEDIQF